MALLSSRSKSLYRSEQGFVFHLALIFDRMIGFARYHGWDSCRLAGVLLRRLQILHLYLGYYYYWIPDHQEFAQFDSRNLFWGPFLCRRDGMQIGFSEGGLCLSWIFPYSWRLLACIGDIFQEGLNVINEANICNKPAKSPFQMAFHPRYSKNWQSVQSYVKTLYRSGIDFL